MKVINGGKRSKTLSVVKPVKNISMNLKSFQEIRSMRKEKKSFFNINCEIKHMSTGILLTKGR